MPPPKQKPTAPILPLRLGPRLQPRRPPRRSPRASSARSPRGTSRRPARRCRDSRRPTSDPSGAKAMKFATANRRATSSMYGFSPRFSWMTRTAGSLPVAFAGLANKPLMLPLPCGDGTVSYFRLDPRVVLRHLLRPRVVRPQAFEDAPPRSARRPRTSCARSRNVAAVDVAVLVLVEEIEQLLRIIGRLLSFHQVLLL